MVQLKNEIWKPIDINPVYLVSNKGRVKTIDHPIWCKANNSYSIRKGHLCALSNNNTKGYYRVGIRVNNTRITCSVHRLVAKAFIPNPNNLPQVNHIDGNKANNCVENLEWCDNAYNQQHAVNNGLKSVEKMSKHSSFRKLTEEQVLFIRQIYSETDFSKRGSTERFNRNMAELFNLDSPNTIHWITTGNTNKFFNQDIVQTTKYDEYLAEYNRICSKNQPKKTATEWARELGINTNSFLTKCRKLNGDINATVQFYKQLYHMQ